MCVMDSVKQIFEKNAKENERVQEGHQPDASFENSRNLIEVHTDKELPVLANVSRVR